MRSVNPRLAELAVSVAIVTFLASVWPTNLMVDFVIQVLLSLVLYGAFALARAAKEFRSAIRVVFWSWFVLMCGIWPLALWMLISKVLSPQRA